METKFEKKLEETTDEELYLWINTQNPNYTVLASNELIRRALNKLQVVIKTFNDQSSKQTEKILKLTRWVVVLTTVMVIGLIVQIILAL